MDKDFKTLLGVVIFMALWFVINVWVLPKLGIRT